MKIPDEINHLIAKYPTAPVTRGTLRAFAGTPPPANATTTEALRQWLDGLPEQAPDTVCVRREAVSEFRATCSSADAPVTAYEYADNLDLEIVERLFGRMVDQTWPAVAYSVREFAEDELFFDEARGDREWGSPNWDRVEWDYTRMRTVDAALEDPRGVIEQIFRAFPRLAERYAFDPHCGTVTKIEEEE